MLASWNTIRNNSTISFSRVNFYQIRTKRHRIPDSFFRFDRKLANINRNIKTQKFNKNLGIIAILTAICVGGVLFTVYRTRKELNLKIEEHKEDYFRCMSLIPPPIPTEYVIKDKHGDGKLVARQKEETKELRQEAIQHLITWIELESNITDSEIRSNISKNASFLFVVNIKRNRYEFFYSSTFESGKQMHVIVNKDKAVDLKILDVDSFINNLSKLFHGNKLEMHFLDESPWLPNRVWSNWEHSTAWGEYTEFIHPMLANIILAVCKLEKLNKPVILEIGCGTGRLAIKIIDQLKNEEYESWNYTGLELNEEATQIARLKVQENATIVKTDIVNERFYSNSNKKMEFSPNSIDIIIGSGILTHSVLENKIQALNALNKIHYYLKDDGILILSGHANSYLNAQDFEKNGFKVINTSWPGRPKQLYIIRKKTTD